MMAVTFHIDGLNLVGSKLARVGPLFVQQARALVAETVLFAEVAIADKIDEYEAVDTGRMKGSVNPATAFEKEDTATDTREGNNSLGVAEVEATVGTNVQYAIPVHEGYTTTSGRDIEGRPFMQDALPEIEEQFVRSAQQRFGSLLS